VQIVELGAADAGELLTLQRAAYVTEAQVYGDPFIAPLSQTLAELERELRDCIALKAVLAGRMVGSVRARVEGVTAHAGRLMVAPDVQRQGIGTRLLRALEDALRERVERIELFTGEGNPGNLRLYQALGYSERRRERAGPRLTLIYLDKRV
jgi:ribosomal protein S18 acetylase RimI-like enzyme